MASRELLLNGLELALIGVGLVFLFLVLLIFCIRIMSVLVARWTPESQPVVAAMPVAVRKQPAADALPDAETLKAIELALRQHRAST